MLTKKNRVWAVVALVAGITGLSACLKSNDNIQPQRPAAYFTFINAVTTPTDLDVYDNGQKINSNAWGIGSGSTFSNTPGAHTYKFTTAGAKDSLTSATQLYDSLHFYTVITYNMGNSVRLYSTRENFTSLSQEKINFRFLNLSENTPAVDLYFDNTKVDSNKTYVFGSGFDFTYDQTLTSQVSEVKVTFAKKDSVIAKTSINSNLLRGGVYTFYLAGRKDSTGVRKLVVGGVMHNGRY